MKTCPRCAECEYSEHHWMDTCETVDRGLETGELIFERVCKHCGLLGTMCEDCDGEGGTCEEDGEVLTVCGTCDGEGAIASCLYSET